MGDWITTDQLADRMGATRYAELLDDDNDGVADPDAAARAIADAEGELNSYLGRRYNLAALATAAEADSRLAATLTAMALNLGEYYVETRRPEGVPDAVERKAAVARAWLKAAVEGEVSLASDADLTTSTQGGGTVDGQTRVFTRDTMDGL